MTGGVGAEPYGEKFGEPFDLPPDRAYADEVNIGTDNLNFEYPTYVKDLKAFVCPATRRDKQKDSALIALNVGHH